jgi:hypothetical protein
MKICDRCKSPANSSVRFSPSDQFFDLCLKCETEILLVVSQNPSSCENIPEYGERKEEESTQKRQYVRRKK